MRSRIIPRPRLRHLRMRRRAKSVAEQIRRPRRRPSRLQVIGTVIALQQSARLARKLAKKMR